MAVDAASKGLRSHLPQVLLHSGHHTRSGAFAYVASAPEPPVKTMYGVVVVLTLTHRRNLVRGHRTGSNRSRVE